MIEKTCRCQKSKKNFRIDIGPFYVEECCIEAGYDELGNKVKSKPSNEEVLKVAEKVMEDHKEVLAKLEDEKVEQPEEIQEVEQVEDKKSVMDFFKKPKRTYNKKVKE